ncbi:50S ribosomal protein L4 [Mycoplasmopsis californica]|uniref:50S ribosomal protein L4 n=1 Tax=Mycoplasmopsis californica TaxID=2113 RepID=UPI000EB6F000|nr:50S ribosomal protein L4 [Mycoplasmopsis californica]BBG42581.1 50S ribosomal protein L4 [Mycoplasmopsis californica]
MAVNKFYLSEKFDKDQNLTFSVKREGLKTARNYKTFKEALEYFTKSAAKLEGESRVWFQIDGQFLGSIPVDKVETVLSTLEAKSVADKDAIKFLNDEKVVDSSEAKAKKSTTKKAETTTVEKKAKVAKVDENAKFNFDTSKLPAEVFGLEKIYEQAIFDTILSERASRRQGTHAVKSRAEVRGGGKKPWKQKGTGRAPAGSTRSPIWVGGGRAFGPRVERNYTLKVNKKVKKAAFFSALTLLAKDNAIVVDDFSLDKISTKDAVAKLTQMNLANVKHVLVVSSNDVVYRSLSNVVNVAVIKPSSVTVEALIWADVVILSNEGLQTFERRAK